MRSSSSSSDQCLDFAGVVVAGVVLGLMCLAMFLAAIEQRYVKMVLFLWNAYLVLMLHAGGMLNTFGNGIVVRLASWRSGSYTKPEALRPGSAAPLA
jgi:hypothetical protein